MHRARIPRLLATHQHRRNKRALIVHRCRTRIAVNNRAIARDLGDLVAHILALAHADERAHARRLIARIADRGFLQACNQRRLRRIEQRRRHERAANGGAFLTGLRRHFLGDLFYEEIKFRRLRRCIGAEHGSVQRILLRNEANTFARDDRMRL